MVPNPCFCGCSLQLTTKIIAVIQMVVAAITVGIYGFSLAGLIWLFRSSKDEDQRGAIVFVMVITMIYVTVNVVYFILGVVLYKGADERDARKLRTWLIVVIVLVVIAVLMLLTVIILMTTSKETQDSTTLQSLIWSIIVVLYRIFCIWVVFAFLQEVKGTGPSTRSMGVVYSTPGTVYNSPSSA